MSAAGCVCVCVCLIGSIRCERSCTDISKTIPISLTHAHPPVHVHTRTGSTMKNYFELFDIFNINKEFVY